MSNFDLELALAFGLRSSFYTQLAAQSIDLHHGGREYAGEPVSENVD